MGYKTKWNINKRPRRPIAWLDYFVIACFVVGVICVASLFIGCSEDVTNISPTAPCCTDTCDGVHTCDGDAGCDDPCANEGKYFTICFRGQTMKVLKTDWDDYKAQGAKKGRCPKPGDDDDDDDGDDDDDDGDDDDDDGDDDDDDGDKVCICHIPPGNPDNAHTICIGAPAVDAHIRNHGDYLGECKN